MSASRIVDGLFVGSAPPPGDYQGKVDVIFLVSDEYQPRDEEFRNVILRRYPFDDSSLPTGQDVATAWAAGRAAARDLMRGRTVLVTCRMGRNRSALVAALALYVVSGEAGSEILKLVQSRRTDDLGVQALSNVAFQRILRGLREREPVPIR